MQTDLRRWRLSETMIEGAPETKGVYVLWDHQTPISVGHALGGADTIQSRLKRHLDQSMAFGTPCATHYSWEICREPLLRAARLAAELGLAREGEYGKVSGFFGNTRGLQSA